MSIPANKGKTKLKWIKNGMFVASLLIMTIMISYSWFNQNKSASVSGVTINVASIPELLINGEKSLQLDFDKDYPLQSVTGNGAFMYTAKIGFPEDIGDKTVVQREVLGYIPVENLDSYANYKEAGAFAYDFKVFMDEDNIDVYLYGADEEKEIPEGEMPDGSWVIPAPEDHYVDRSNQSHYGEFDIGYITGAVRVAFLQKDANGVYQPTLIWIPDTTTKLTVIDDDTATLETDSSDVEATYTFLGETVDDKIEISTNGESSGSVQIDGVTYAWGELDERQQIGTLTLDRDNEFRLVIWIEGTDRECHNALLDGLICVNLKIGT